MTDARPAPTSHRWTRWDWVCVALIFCTALALYALTLNGDVQPADSGELQLAADTLQVAHPPGYPLLTVLGWLISRLPMATPFVLMSLLSALASSLTLVIVYATVRHMAPQANPLSRFWAILAVAALATSSTFWSQATTFNVRSLTALFTAGMAFAVVQASVQPRFALGLMAIVVGLGVGHHVSLIFIAALLSLYVVACALKAHLPLGDYTRALALLLGTQLVWLYLPLRNAAPGVLAHGNLATLSGFLDHVLARGFGGDLFYFILVEPAQLWNRLSTTPTLFQFQFSLPILIALLIGVGLALYRHRAVGLLFVAAIALHWFVTITYKAPQTVEYAMPCWVLLCVLLGGWQHVPRLWSSRRHRSRSESQRPVMSSHPRRPFIAFIAIGLPLLIITLFITRDTLARWPSYRALAQDHSTRAAAESLLRQANPNAQVFSEWHQATPMWALQAIEGQRPDIQVTYVSPSGTQAYEDTFAERAALALSHGSVYVTSHFPAALAAQHRLAIPISNTPSWQVVTQAIPPSADLAPTTWGDRITLLHPQALPQRVSVGQQFKVDLWWTTHGQPNDGDAITVRLMYPDGRLAANADVQLNSNAGPDIYSARRVVLAVPWQLPPGQYDLLAGAYNGGTIYKTQAGQDFVPVGQIQISPADQSPITQNTMNALNSALLGADYDLSVPNQLRVYTHWQLQPNVPTQTVRLRAASGQVLLERTLPAYAPHLQQAQQFVSLVFDVPPQQGLQIEMNGTAASLPLVQPAARYIPFANQMVWVGASHTRANTSINVDVRWLSAQAITDDYRVSVRIGGDNGLYQTHDGYPALGTLPTFKWIRGALITDRHPFTLNNPNDAKSASVVVYDFTTRLELKPLDERADALQLTLSN